jgi:large subunit ribosomal protein L35
MPKLKTHSGTKDRMKVTKNGKVLQGRAGANHLLQKKSAARKRSFAVPTLVTGKSARNIKRKLGVQ